MNNYSQRAQWTALMAVSALAVYLCWLIFQPFLFVFLWAAVAAIVFQPPYQWLLRRTRMPALSAALAVTMVIVAVVIPLAFVSTLVTRELSVAVTNLREGVTKLLDDPHWGMKIREYTGLAKRHLNLDQVLSKVSNVALSRTNEVLVGAFGLVVNLFFTIFTMFFLFRDGGRIVATLSGFLPLDAPSARRMLSRTAEIINASVYGVFVIALVQGLLGGLMFWILGIGAALVWTVVMIILCTIPMAGSFIVWAPAAIYLAVTGHWIKAVILVVWGSVVIGMADNILRPRLVGQRTRMHELLVFFSVLGGLQVFGALGILLGPVVFAITVALLDALRVPDQQVAEAE